MQDVLQSYMLMHIRRLVLIFHKGRHVWTRRRPNKPVKAIGCDSFSNILLITCHSLRSKILLISVERWRELIDINGFVDAEVQDTHRAEFRREYCVFCFISSSTELVNALYIYIYISYCSRCSFSLWDDMQQAFPLWNLHR